MDVAIACLRHVIRLIWHLACLPHTVHLSSIDFWPVCNGSLPGGDITQLNLLNAGLCHHPSVPSQQRFLRSLQHSATNSGNCHLAEKKYRLPSSRVAGWALLPTGPLRTVRESCPFIRLKPPPGTFPHPASLRLTAGDAPVCDNWGGEGAS
jgi:hypothetical protein